MAAAARQHHVSRRRRRSRPMRRPGSTSPISCSSIRSEPATAAPRPATRMRAASFFSVDGDANALAVMIRKWVEKNGRQGAVKFVVGESYGGFRVPKVARALTWQGVGVRGLVMISPVLDFTSLGNRRHDPMIVGDAASVDGGDRAGGHRAVRSRAAARGRELRVRRLSARPHAGREGQCGGRTDDAADRRLYRTRSRGGETARGADRQRDVPARAQSPARPGRERL